MLGLGEQLPKAADRSAKYQFGARPWLLEMDIKLWEESEMQAGLSEAFPDDRTAECDRTRHYHSGERHRRVGVHEHDHAPANAVETALEPQDRGLTLLFPRYRVANGSLDVEHARFESKDVRRRRVPREPLRILEQMVDCARVKLGHQEEPLLFLEKLDESPGIEEPVEDSFAFWSSRDALESLIGEQLGQGSAGDR